MISTRFLSVFYSPSLLAGLSGLNAPSTVERRLPTQRYALMNIRTTPGLAAGLARNGIINMIRNHDIKCAAPSYFLEDAGKSLRYEFTLRSINSHNFERLAETLQNTDNIIEFSVVPSGEQRVRISGE